MEHIFVQIGEWMWKRGLSLRGRCMVGRFKKCMLCHIIPARRQRHRLELAFPNMQLVTRTTGWAGPRASAFQVSGHAADTFRVSDLGMYCRDGCALMQIWLMHATMPSTGDAVLLVHIRIACTMGRGISHPACYLEREKKRETTTTKRDGNICCLAAAYWAANNQQALPR